MANLTNIIHAAINLSLDYDAKIAEARTALKGKTPEEIRETLLPIVAASPKYQVPVIDGERKAKGKKVLDKSHPKYETCRSMLSDIVADIVGKVVAKADQYEIPEELLAAALTLVKRAKQYDENIMRTLASQALAHAWTQVK